MSTSEIVAGPGVAVETLDVSIIVPTYGEAENLPTLIPRITAALEDAGLRGEIVVVDDNSPDDTAEVCRRLAIDHPLRLEIRTRDRGLSSAVIHGMTLAEGAVLLVMDADLSHPAEKIPELVAAVRSANADFAIGSRYVQGGGTDDDWGLFRWLNSKVATLLAWPLTSAKDPMAGFFAIGAASFRNADQLNPVGYKIGLELMVKCGCRNVHEVPIHFRDRLHGESKLTLREQLNYLRHLKRLYDYKLGHLSRFAQFVTVGGTGMAVDFVSFSLLLTVVPLSSARALAIWAAMSWNFFLNRRITFADAPRGRMVRQYAMFCLACLLGALVNWSLSVWLCGAFAFFDQFKLAAAFVGIVGGTAFNYLLSCRIFRPSAASG